MKKILGILICCFLFSCDRIYEEDIVVSVKEFKKGRFEVQTVHYSFCTNSVYRIGDTIILRKKKWKQSSLKQ